MYMEEIAFITEKELKLYAACPWDLYNKPELFYAAFRLELCIEK